MRTIKETALQLEKLLINFHGHRRASLVAQLVRNLPAIQETLVQFLGWEDPLEKGQPTHSSILGLPWGAQMVSAGWVHPSGPCTRALESHGSGYAGWVHMFGPWVGTTCSPES